MVKNKNQLKKFEKRFILKNKLNYKKSLQIFEAVWKYAVEMKILFTKKMLDGIDVDIQVAKVLNTCLEK